MSFGPPPTIAPAGRALPALSELPAAPDSPHELDLRIAPATLIGGPRQPPPTLQSAPPPAAERPPTVDVAGLTEAVQRGLFRALARERERRGGGA